MNASNDARFEQEKQAYRRMRNELLVRYPDQWVAIVGGQVVASCEKKMTVLKNAFAATQSEVGYITCVGHEDKVDKKRVRSIVAGKYDRRYEPLIPTVTASVIEQRRRAVGETIAVIVADESDIQVLRPEEILNARVWAVAA